MKLYHLWTGSIEGYRENVKKCWHYFQLYRKSTRTIEQFFLIYGEQLFSLHLRLNENGGNGGGGGWGKFGNRTVASRNWLWC